MPSKASRLYPAEWRAWIAMKTRCNNPKNPSWKNYGARGIRVCPRWEKSFTAFLTDVGQKPSPELVLGRLDVNRDYEPANVEWTTMARQNDRRRPCHFVTVGSQSMTMAAAARAKLVSKGTVRYRVKVRNTSDPAELFSHDRLPRSKPNGMPAGHSSKPTA